MEITLGEALILRVVTLHFLSYRVNYDYDHPTNRDMAFWKSFSNFVEALITFISIGLWLFSSYIIVTKVF